MIDVHYWPTPNGWKVTIMLEECELPYRVVPVDIAVGDQFRPDFLRISPNNRMPAIVDHAPLGGGDPLTIFESGAILEYLAEAASGAKVPHLLKSARRAGLLAPEILEALGLANQPLIRGALRGASEVETEVTP